MNKAYSVERDVDADSVEDGRFVDRAKATANLKVFLRKALEFFDTHEVSDSGDLGYIAGCIGILMVDQPTHTPANLIDIWAGYLPYRQFDYYMCMASYPEYAWKEFDKAVGITKRTRTRYKAMREQEELLEEKVHEAQLDAIQRGVHAQ